MYIKTVGYPYPIFRNSTFTPMPLMLLQIPLTDIELNQLLISAHEMLGVLKGIVRFAPDSNALKNLLLLKETCKTLQIDDKGEGFFEIMRARPGGIDKRVLTIQTREILSFALENSFSISSIGKMFDLLANPEAEAEALHITAHDRTTYKVIVNGKKHEMERSERVYATFRDISQFMQRDFPFDILIRIAMVHYQFEMLCPLPCYNGIIGRAAILMMLIDAGYDAAAYLCLSDFLFQNKQDYFSQLSSTQRSVDYLSWIKFVLRGVIGSATKSITLIEQYEMLVYSDREKVQKFALSNNTLRVYDYFKASLASEIKIASEKLDLSFNTVSQAVALLQKKKILELSNEQSRHRWFIYRKALDLFV